MKKFSENISDKDSSLEFKTGRKGKETTSHDVEKMDDMMADESEKTKLDGEWEIVSIIDVSKNEPDLNESIIVNAELGDKSVKRGDYIYVTAMIHRKGGSAYHQQQMGVIRCRVVDIYNNLFILNNLK
jgi:hypothetical protein